MNEYSEDKVDAKKDEVEALKLKMKRLTDRYI